MGRIRLGVGTEWLLDGRAWRVVRQLAPDRFVAQDGQRTRRFQARSPGMDGVRANIVE
jgi:hypothetical protein